MTEMPGDYCWSFFLSLTLPQDHDDRKIYELCGFVAMCKVAARKDRHLLIQKSLHLHAKARLSRRH